MKNERPLAGSSFIPHPFTGVAAKLPPLIVDRASARGAGSPPEEDLSPSPAPPSLGNGLLQSATILATQQFRATQAIAATIPPMTAPTIPPSRSTMDSLRASFFSLPPAI